MMVLCSILDILFLIVGGIIIYMFYCATRDQGGKFDG